VTALQLEGLISREEIARMGAVTATWLRDGDVDDDDAHLIRWWMGDESSQPLLQSNGSKDVTSSDFLSTSANVTRDENNFERR